MTTGVEIVATGSTSARVRCGAPPRTAGATPPSSSRASPTAPLYRVDLATGRGRHRRRSWAAAPTRRPRATAGSSSPRTAASTSRRSGIDGDDLPRTGPDARHPARRTRRHRHATFGEHSIDGGFLGTRTISSPTPDGTLYFTDPPEHPPPAGTARPGPRVDADGAVADGCPTASTTATASRSSPTARWSSSRRGLLRLGPTAHASGSWSSCPHGTGDGLSLDVDGRFYVALDRRPRRRRVRARRHRGRLPRDRGVRGSPQLLLRRPRRPDPLRHGRHPRAARRLGGYPHPGLARPPVARGLTPRATVAAGSRTRTPGVPMRAAIFVENDRRCRRGRHARRARPARRHRAHHRQRRLPLRRVGDQRHAAHAAPCILGHEGAGVVEWVGPEVTRRERRRPRDRLVHPRVRQLLLLPARPVEPLREHLHGHDAPARRAPTARRSAP